MLVKFAIQDFIEDRKFKNLSERTVKGYLLCLKKLEDFLTQKGIIEITDITATAIKEFLIMLKNTRNNNPTSINTKLKNLKAFFNYLEYEEIIEAKQNPTKKVNYVKEEIKIEVFTDSQIKIMLNYYRRLKRRCDLFFAYRDYAIIVTLLGTGIRLGELSNLNWKDIDFINNSIMVYGKKREFSSIPMNDKLKMELCEYRIYNEKTFDSVTEYVFTNRWGKQLTDNAIKNIFKRLKDIMNFKDVRLSAHTFRHTFAHRCIVAGMDVFTLQRMLRHSNISMTQKYLALWEPFLLFSWRALVPVT